MSYWFRPKRYGYGSTPSNWKGWLATILFVALIVGISKILEQNANPVWLAIAAAVTILFVWLVWTKTSGEWRWRWGSTDKEK
ncbi:MAG: hypothetical protein WBX25_02550 [Rhodomicrobium sp.]